MISIEKILPQLFQQWNIQSKIISVFPLSGGTFGDTYSVKTEGKKYFLKVNQDDQGMLKSEFLGLDILRSSNTIPIPEVLGQGMIQRQSFLLMDFIEQGNQNKKFWSDFGKNLAELHKVRDEHFGLDHDNFIGSLPQQNNQLDTWAEFFIAMRLEPLVKMAQDNGRMDSSLQRKFSKLYLIIESFFPIEKPSLLHGDLWSGNYMTTSKGEAIIFDPAVYFGHREMDIGMTKLFGGFSQEFYESYNEHFPMELKWQERIEVTNLYPLLVHVNLFGGSYLQDVKSVIKRMVG